MTEQFLHHAQIGASVEQMGRVASAATRGGASAPVSAGRECGGRRGCRAGGTWR